MLVQITPVTGHGPSQMLYHFVLVFCPNVFSSCNRDQFNIYITGTWHRCLTSRKRNEQVRSGGLVARLAKCDAGHNISHVTSTCAP